MPGIGQPEEFPAGATLFKEGHRPIALWYIESGLVKTVRMVGSSDTLVSPRRAGWILGLAPAYLNTPYSASALTATGCVLRSIRPEVLWAAIEAAPPVARSVLRRVLAQGRSDEIQRAEMAACSASERLARTLLRLAAVIDAPHRQGRVELALPVTNRELAQLVGTSPQHLSRLLAAFEASGRLYRRSGTFLLPVKRWPRLARTNPRSDV